MRSLRPLAFVLLLVGPPLVAETTEVEKLYLQLRKSDNRELKLLSQRLYSMIKVQEWSDLSGKFSVTAKYIESDDDAETVTLMVERRTDQGRGERQVKVPVDKLSKTCQARVNRIVRLLPILEEKIAAAEAEEKEKKDGGGQVGPFGEEGRRRDNFEGEGNFEGEQGVLPPDYGAGISNEATANVPPGYEEAPIGASDVIPGNESYQEYGQGYPAGPPYGEAANRQQPYGQPTYGQPVYGQPVYGEQPYGGPGPRERFTQTDTGDAILPDQAPWRFNYPAFLAAIAVQPATVEGGEAILDVSALGDFGAAIEAHWQAMNALASGGPPEAGDRAMLPPIENVGEVVWEATLTAPIAPGADLMFDLPAPPEPLTLTFTLDHEQNSNAWQNLQPGARVRFVGRLSERMARPQITFVVRFLESVAGEFSPTDADEGIAMPYPVGPPPGGRPGGEDPQTAFFHEKIEPVLAAKCYACHSAGARELMAELSLDSQQGMLIGGANGSVISPGDPANSLLVKALKGEDGMAQMPPKGGPLPPEVIADFENWIAMGAPDPRIPRQLSPAK